MDQTPILHAMNPKDTIDRRRLHTINLRMAGGDSRRVTVAITIAVSGHQLPLLVVFKGKTFFFAMRILFLTLWFIVAFSLQGCPME
jgi:hypothetical protein